jgi:hypothetical protein
MSSMRQVNPSGIVVSSPAGTNVPSPHGGIRRAAAAAHEPSAAWERADLDATAGSVNSLAQPGEPEAGADVGERARCRGADSTWGSPTVPAYHNKLGIDELNVAHDTVTGAGGWGR